MKIAIEALGIHSYGGGRTATLNLLRSLISLDDQNEYLFILSQPEPELSSLRARQYIFPVKDRFVMRIWAQLAIPFLAQNYDLIHFAKNLGVLGLNIPHIITVYDLTTLIYPELFPRADVLYWKHIQRIVFKKATKIIAISQQTAQDLQFFYKLPSSKIEIVYLAPPPHFRPSSPEVICRIKTAYGLPDYYVLHVGRIDPKKNIPLLIEAFSLFCGQTMFPGKLVLVGEFYKKKPDLRVYSYLNQPKIREKVQLVGAVPDAYLPAFYSGATMVVLPSIHEGFGLAALEALACGAPLIVNKAGALKEVVDDAALFMESNTPECLADLMKLIWSDPLTRQALREAGPKQAAKFSWEKTARQTIDIYSRVKLGHEN
ncbi:MAG: glycosyltransferase family 1 protein [Anaerolineae bacterium]|nr:glycosyltransferase family 1 protein [Anaerolineae bacterium]